MAAAFQGYECGPPLGVHNSCQEALKAQLTELKVQRSNLRKDMRDNRKKAKNASKRKKRLVQALLAPPHTVMF